MQMSGKLTCCAVIVKNHLTSPHLIFISTDLNVLYLFSGEGGKIREHKTSLHAIGRIVRNEGILGVYNG